MMSTKEKKRKKIRKEQLPSLCCSSAVRHHTHIYKWDFQPNHSIYGG